MHDTLSSPLPLHPTPLPRARPPDAPRSLMPASPPANATTISFMSANCAAPSRPTLQSADPKQGCCPFLLSYERFGLALVDEQCRRASATSKVERAPLFAVKTGNLTRLQHQ